MPRAFSCLTASHIELDRLKGRLVHGQAHTHMPSCKTRSTARVRVFQEADSLYSTVHKPAKIRKLSEKLAYRLWRRGDEG